MIIAVDPGAMCGLFWWNQTTGQCSGGDASAYITVRNIQEHFITVDNWTVVVERYTITAATVKMTRQYDALETIGALRYLARQYNVKFELQSRGDRLRVSDGVLKKIGWWTPTPEGHTNEAARHCFVALARHFPNHDLVKQSLDMI